MTLLFKTHMVLHMSFHTYIHHHHYVAINSINLVLPRICYKEARPLNG